jgi:catecholate siderophore receptor
VDFHNNRTGADNASADRLLSPRAAIIVKPASALSVYASYSVAYVPRAGEQLSSLTLSNKALDPERFRQYEVGAKWEIRPDLAATAAVYRLDRRNIAVPDPANPSLSLLVDGQEASGLELECNGRLNRRWDVIAGYAYQRGEVTRSLSANALAGARLAQLPAHTVSLWNKVDVTRRIAAALGIIRRGAMFTSTDNSVVVPGFTRVDAAAYVTLTPRLRVQANVENALDRRYFASAHSNQNIMPGSPRAVRVTATTSF